MYHQYFEYTLNTVGDSVLSFQYLCGFAKLNRLRVPSRALRIQGNLNPFFIVFSGIPGLLDTVGTIDLGWEPVGTKIRLRREMNIMII